MISVLLRNKWEIRRSHFEDEEEVTMVMFITGLVAKWLGTTEPAFRLLLSILLGYPLALVHRRYVFGQPPFIQHLYFCITGIALGFFNYGWEIIHSALCIIIIYLILFSIGGTLKSVIVSFTFLMTYLTVGYYCTGTKDYDIKWSLPHCVLTLRLIGLSYDVFDGKKDFEKLPRDQKKTALQEKPSLLEIASFTYFFGGFLVGPQFSMRRYLDFIDGKFNEKIKTATPSCSTAAWNRLALGMLILGIYQVGSIFFPERFMLTDTYNSYPFWKRLLVLGIWGKISLNKYVACWLISEGSCILCGLTYNDKNNEGDDLWDGCANVDLWHYEKTTTFDGIIRSFNINTNRWAAQYIFKRLKFLGNKLLSQFLTLAFLAVWHGLHSGYYICFFNEFIVMKFERDMIKILNENETAKLLINHSALQVPLFIFNKIFVLIFFGYCVVPFMLLSFDRWYNAYASIYFIGHIIYLGWPVYKPFVRMAIPRTKLPTEKFE